MAAADEGDIPLMASMVQVCILRTDGTNCDEELAFAFSLAGAQPDYVHVNQLRSGEKRLSDYQILGIPGGFSYGDDVASGKILAVELLSFLKQQIGDFVAAKKPVIGICNGFQILVNLGLLPALDNKYGTRDTYGFCCSSRFRGFCATDW